MVSVCLAANTSSPTLSGGQGRHPYHGVVRCPRKGLVAPREGLTFRVRGTVRRTRFRDVVYFGGATGERREARQSRDEAEGAIKRCRYPENAPCKKAAELERRVAYRAGQISYRAASNFRAGRLILSWLANPNPTSRHPPLRTMSPQCFSSHIHSSLKLVCLGPRSITLNSKPNRSVPNLLSFSYWTNDYSSWARAYLHWHWLLGLQPIR